MGFSIRIELVGSLTETTLQRDAFVSPQESDTIYNLDTKVLETYNGTSWI